MKVQQYSVYLFSVLCYIFHASQFGHVARGPDGWCALNQRIRFSPPPPTTSTTTSIPPREESEKALGGYCQSVTSERA